MIQEKSQKNKDSIKGNKEMSPQLITREELAKLLKLHVRTLIVRREEFDRVIPPVKFNNRSVRYRLSDVQKMINQGGF